MFLPPQHPHTVGSQHCPGSSELLAWDHRVPWCQPVDSASTPSALSASWAWAHLLTSWEVLRGLVKAQKSDSSFLRSQSRLGNAVLTSVSHQNTVGETSTVDCL